MRLKDQFLNGIKLFLIIVLLIPLKGCYVGQPVTKSEIPPAGAYKYVIHSGPVEFRLDEAVLNEGIISGFRHKGKAGHGKKVEFFLPDDSLISRQTSGVISVHMSDVSEVHKSKFSFGLTTLFILGISPIAIPVITLSVLAIAGGYDM